MNPENSSLSAYDGITGVALAIMILVIVFAGNGKTLIDALKGEKGFVKWVLALFILSWISNSKILGETGTVLLTGVYILMLMKIVTNNQIMNSIKTVWNSF